MGRFVSGNVGSSAKRQITSLIYSDTGVFTAPYDMEVIIHAFGGGGMGGISGSGRRATGGGAGAYVKKRVKLKANETVAITIPNIPALSPTAGVQTDGVDAGDTTVVGPAFNLIAGGGKGGKASSTATDPLLGGVGGIGSGGDVNRPGGRGGDIVANLTNVGRCITGGGAVCIFGTDCHGGDITANGHTADTQMTVSGGASIVEAAQTVPTITGMGAPGRFRAYLNRADPTFGTTAVLLQTFPLFGIFKDAGPEQLNGLTDTSTARVANGFGSGERGSRSATLNTPGLSDAEVKNVFGGGGGSVAINSQVNGPCAGGPLGGGGGGSLQQTGAMAAHRGSKGGVILEILE